MKTLFSLPICLALACGMAYGQPDCLQDQYGNQYNFSVDTNHEYIYGTANVVQCGVTSPLTGSYTTNAAGELGLEITVAVASGPGCVPIYTLKGIYPSFQWYYDNGFGAQQAVFASCGTKVAPNNAGKGALK